MSFSIPVRNLSSTSPVSIELDFSTWSTAHKRFLYTLGAGTTTVVTGTFMYPVGAGMDMMFVAARAATAPGAEFGSGTSTFESELLMTVIPQ